MANKPARKKKLIKAADDAVEVLEAFERVAIRLFIFGMAVYGLVRAAVR